MVILGLGQRGTKYAEYAVGNPGEFSLAAIIENDPRRAEAGKKVFQGVPFFSDYREFLEKKIPADIVAVATQDKDHKEHAIAMMRAGYDLLLEKPISNNEADCRAIYEESKNAAARSWFAMSCGIRPFIRRLNRSSIRESSGRSST